MHSAAAGSPKVHQASQGMENLPAVCTHHLAAAPRLAGLLHLEEVVVSHAGLPVRRGPVGGHDSVEGPVLRGVLQGRKLEFQGFYGT